MKVVLFVFKGEEMKIRSLEQVFFGQKIQFYGLQVELEMNWNYGIGFRKLYYLYSKPKREKSEVQNKIF